MPDHQRVGSAEASPLGNAMPKVASMEALEDEVMELDPTKALS